MSANKLLYLVVLTIFGIHLSSCSINKTEQEWKAAGQKTIWEASQIFHRTLIGVSAMEKTGEGRAPKFVNSVTKFSSKLAGIFGVAGAIFSIILAIIPGAKTESAELKYMKTEFGKLSQKVDSLAVSIDNVKDIIKLSAQKAAYVKDQNKIHHAASQMAECQKRIENVSCTGQQECKRKKIAIAQSYVAAMNVRENVDGILRGAINDTAFGSSLLDLTQAEGDCNMNQINRFVNRIVALLTKGMRAVIFHDLLTKTDYEYLTDVDRMYQMLKELETARQNIEDDCFQSINDYIYLDVKNSQAKFTVNSKQTNIRLLHKLASKYPWIDWHVITVLGDKAPVVRSTVPLRSRLVSSSKEKKVHAFVIPTMDRKVKQLHLKGVSWFEMIKNIQIENDDTEKAADNLQTQIKLNSKLNGKVQSFALIEGRDIVLGYYINKKMSQFLLNGTILTNMNVQLSKPHPIASFAVAVTFSFDKKPLRTCSKACENNGVCYFYPYSNKMECKCNGQFSGERCEFSDKNFRHQFVINSILKNTMKLPSFASIQNTLEDTHLYVKTSLMNIGSSIATLEAKIDEKFKVLGSFMSEKLDWFNVLLKYKDAISNLDYFQSLSYRKMKEAKWAIDKKFNGTLVEASKQTTYVEDKEIARYLLGPVGIQMWLYQLNFLIVGRNDNEFNSHKSILFLVMDKYKRRLCHPDYKAEIDRTFRQLMLLQLRGYILWTQAYSLMNLDSSAVIKRYTMVLDEQKKYLQGATCSVDIPNSKNFQKCSGGYYVHSTMNATVLCNDGFYLYGKQPPSTVCSFDCIAFAGNEKVGSPISWFTTPVGWL